MHLETPRLLLRDFTLADLERIYALVYADPQVKDSWSTVTGTREQIQARFAARYIYPPGEFGLKALALQSPPELIGLMGFQKHAPALPAEIPYLLTASQPQRSVNLDPACLEVELTYALGRDYWRHGYAAEMARALIDYGFATLGIGRIIQGVLASNAGSVHLMRSLGFRLEPGLDPTQVVGVLER